MVQMPTQLYECSNQVGNQSYPDLCHDRIHAVADKSLDFGALLDPLEKQLDLPALFVDGCDCGSRPLEVVCNEYKILLRSRIEVVDPSELSCVFFALNTGQVDVLIGQHTGPRNQWAILHSFVPHVELCTSDKRAVGFRQSVEPGIVTVPSVKNVHRSRYEFDLRENLVIMPATFRDADDFREPTGMIKTDVDFDPCFVGTAISPRKQLQTKVDEGGVQRDQLPVHWQFSLSGEFLTTGQKPLEQITIQVWRLPRIQPPKCRPVQRLASQSQEMRLQCFAAMIDFPQAGMPGKL